MVWQQWIPCVQYVQGVQCGTMCMCRRYTLHWPVQQGTIDNAKPCTVLTHTSNSDTSQIFSLSLTSNCTKMCLKIDGNLQGENPLNTGCQKHEQVAGFVTGTWPLNNNSWDTLWISCNEMFVAKWVGCSNISWNKLHLFFPKFKSSFTTFLRTRLLVCVQSTTEPCLRELRDAALGAKELIRLLMHYWHLNENVCVQ